jgi:Uma2 family endonuclease
MLSTKSTPQSETVEMDGQRLTVRPASPLPPLENGDRLTRREFERRYEAMAGLKKAELIEGIVYLPSPVRAMSHALPHSHIMSWLGQYVLATRSVLGLDNPTLRLDEDNEPQPDAVLMIEPAHGGHASITDDDYLAGAPELIVEIASSSTSYDLHQKFNVYRRAGVGEYLVWQVREQEVHWWRLSEGLYVPVVADDAGVLRSTIFPGLWLPANALLQGDMQTVMSILQQGLQSSDHTSFNATLTAPA